MPYETILVAADNSTCTITINRPDKLNALNRKVIEELSDALDEIYHDKTIASVIITGAGQKAFAAGADITEFLQLDASQGEMLARSGQQTVFDKIEQCPKPVIAAVNGFALGGGCELMLACHFAIASDNAKIGQPEINLGLIPGYGGTQRLAQAAGKGRAMQLMMTGEMITAEEAMQYGIINKTVKQEDLMAAVREITNTINSKSPLAVSKVIECVNNFDHTQQGYELEMKRFGECFNTHDMQEGAAAFIEKRKPVFKGL